MVQFQRSTVVLDSFTQKRIVSEPETPRPTVSFNPQTAESSVLVINASHEMAKEITLQLTLQMPGCSITYAPTVELARWILKKKKIDLVVSSPVLPDGPITKLRETLQSLSTQPDMVVVGKINVRGAESLSSLGYEHSSIHRISQPSKVTQLPKIQRRKVDETVKTLGADIRNDLNNPLQEIVAMVFVAKASGQSEAAEQALEAIEKAAKNMAQVVGSLEDKIRGAVL